MAFEAALQKLRALLPVYKTTDISLEGQTPRRGRSLEYYEILLRFNPYLLHGKTILDFGCGNSNIGIYLNRQGIEPRELLLVDRNPQVLRKNPQAIIADDRNLNDFLTPGSIDIALALFSTYLIPLPYRFIVFSQLMAVTGGFLHVGPVYGEDFDWLRQNSSQHGFDMLISLPFQGDWREDPIQPTTQADYQTIANYPQEST